MTINKFIHILFFFVFISSQVKSNQIENSISLNYNNIFNKKILSETDISKYQQIYTLQKTCKWKQANKIILTLEKDILMGHILSQRYLHPKCYRSQFIELTHWLKKYNDHPQAKRIYRLAVRRMPEGYKSPKKPIKAIGLEINQKEIQRKSTKYKSKMQLSKNQRKEKNKLLIGIKARVNKGWPTGALKLLNQKYVKDLLDNVEIDQQKELIAKGYFLANKNNLAIKYAQQAIKRSPEHVSFANWTAGLSAYRLKDYKLAANFFETFSDSQENDIWHRSSGAFWAARSYEQLKEYDKINKWLNIAAKNPKTFYGQLAINIMGVNGNITWNKIDRNLDSEKIFLKYPAGERILALIQVGIISEVEREILKLNASINQEMALASLDIASKFNFAYTQLKIANKLESLGYEVPINYFYPKPAWMPKSGYKVDKALIYAFIHQESGFNHKAKSRKGAIGLMQIMPSTARYISKNKSISKNNSSILLDPHTNIEIGQDYIEYLLNLDIVANNTVYMAASYNAGPGNLKKWLKEINHQDDTLLFMESIPSRETRWFMEKILTNYWIYKNQFNETPLSLTELAKGMAPIYIKRKD